MFKKILFSPDDPTGGDGIESPDDLLDPTPPTPSDDPSPQQVMTYQNLILQEENRRLKEAASRANIPAPTPAPIPQLGEGDVFNQPNKLIDAFKQVVQQQIAPLQDFMNSFQQQQAYTNLKNNVRAQFPAFAQIESLVDQYMVGQAPTPENLTRCIQQAVGAAALSNPSFLNPNPNSPNNPTPPRTPTPVNPPVNRQVPPIPPNPNQSRPPHLRPSGSPAAIDKDTVIDMNQFDENSKRLMRENNLNPKQWLFLQDLPADKLTSKETYKKLKELANV